MVEPELKPMSFPPQSPSPSPILPLRSHLCESSKYSWPLLSSFSVSFPSLSDSGDFSVLSHCSGVPLCICSVFLFFHFYESYELRVQIFWFLVECSFGGMRFTCLHEHELMMFEVACRNTKRCVQQNPCKEQETLPVFWLMIQFQEELFWLKLNLFFIGYYHIKHWGKKSIIKLCWVRNKFMLDLGCGYIYFLLGYFIHVCFYFSVMSKS